MQIIYTNHQLLKDKLCFLFFQPPFRLSLQIGIQRILSNIFHNQMNLSDGINRLIKLANIRMAQLLHEFYFSLHIFSSLSIKKLEFFISLDSYIVPSCFVSSKSDCCICSRSKHFAHIIIINCDLII